MSDNTTDMPMEDERIIHLRDEDAGFDVPTQVIIEIEKDGREFALLTPAAPEILIFQEKGEDALEWLDNEEVKALKKDVDHALSSHNLKLEPKGDFLYLSGEIPEAFIEDAEIFDIPGEDEDEDETMIVLLTMEDGEKTYLLCAPAQPTMVVAELVGEGAKIVTDEGDLEQLMKIMEPIVAELDAALQAELGDEE